LISFDPLAFVLDLFTQSDAKTKAVEDEASAEMTMFESSYNIVKSFASRFASRVRLSGSQDLSNLKQDVTAAVNSKVVDSIASASSSTLAPIKSAPKNFARAEKIVVKLVVAVDSKWTTYRFRVPKVDFHFDDLKHMVEERWSKEKSKVQMLSGWRMKYQDDEREWVTVQNQSEWEEAIRVGQEMVRLHVCSA